MQNTVVEQAELRFLRVLNPLLRRSLPLRKVTASLVEITRRSVREADDLLEERYQNVYLLVCLLLGLAALGIGYLTGFVLGR